VLPPCANPVAGTGVSVRKIVDLPNMESPVLVTSPVNDPRQFVVTRDGTIRILEDEVLREPAFLDLSEQLFIGGEAGLLGLAFHPQYATNRRFFLYYTRRETTDATFNLRNVVARCEVSMDPSIADPATCVEILAIRDNRANHNGGMIEFGRDGFLYIGTGDGGGAGDPQGNAQTLQDGMPTSLSTALLGKLLRIDVDVEANGKLYGIPADNPFLTSGAPEIYARGLRNPWRWSFDRANGDLWIGDVGQRLVEEIDLVKAGELAGANFGWKNWEGSSCFDTPCPTEGRVFPVSERLHAAPDLYTAIIGGQVYRGTCFPDLAGTYFYADHNGGQIAAAIETNGAVTVTDLEPLPGETFPQGVSSIHEDAHGELYLTTIAVPGAGRLGAVFRIEVHP
jgi:glucose/arabinose dehydrogenase